MQTSLYIGSFGLAPIPPEATNMVCIVVVKHSSHCRFFVESTLLLGVKKALHIPPLSVQAKGKSMQNHPEEQVFVQEECFIRESVKWGQLTQNIRGALHDLKSPLTAS